MDGYPPAPRIVDDGRDELVTTRTKMDKAAGVRQRENSQELTLAGKSKY